jgi:hypothetical protein
VSGFFRAIGALAQNFGNQVLARRARAPSTQLFQRIRKPLATTPEETANGNTVHLTILICWETVNSAGALRFAWTQRVIAHFSLYAARVEAIATGTDSLLQDLLKNGIMKGFSVPRGE